jgi:hypothetical protein
VRWSRAPSTDHADDARNASPAGFANWVRTAASGNRIRLLASTARAT